MAALRRPPWTDWALNRCADADPQLVRQFADAADAMREAQDAAVEGRTVDVAGALRSLRDGTTALARQADRELTNAGRASGIPELMERLAAVAADPVATTQLREAVLLAGGDTGDAIVGLPSSAAPPRQRGGRRTAPPAIDDAAERATERRRLIRELADVERAQRTAEHELVRATRATDEASTRRDLASAAVERAQADLAAAEQQLEAADERRRTLERTARETRRSVDALRAELDRSADP